MLPRKTRSGLSVSLVRQNNHASTRHCERTVSASLTTTTHDGYVMYFRQKSPLNAVAPDPKSAMADGGRHARGLPHWHCPPLQTALSHSWGARSGLRKGSGVKWRRQK
jgi:hypothetical protein